MMMRALILSCFLVCLLAPTGARASCISATNCLCTSVDTVVDARIVAIDGAKSTVRADAISGSGEQISVGETFDLPRGPEHALDARLLVYFFQGDIPLVVPVSEKGEVTCVRAEPDFVISAGDAISAALSNDCRGALASHGFQEPPCNDVGIGFGCAQAGASFSAGLLPLVWLGMRWRRNSRMK